MAKARGATNKRQRVKRDDGEALEPFFTRTRIRKGAGFALVLTGIFLTVAFLSYFFTWKADQDQVLETSWRIVFPGHSGIENKLGGLAPG